MTTLADLRVHRQEILSLAAEHGARNVRVFGSVARGTADEASDIDILVDLQKGRSLLDLGKFLSDLNELLGPQVDVVTTSGLRGRIKEHVLSEAIAL